ncbi:addiction module protein [Fodinibius salsisoli]|uniref:Addiction module protein n=1 Tax=Fodinibius salsisoli TaxID=2820877 RepID=A0ABT3PSI6_9BACT|nr:addiction module protein [Fodinibius salsisoli]MCW9708830.1 addiction module protein [Fodinibius salsisoli]
MSTNNKDSEDKFDEPIEGDDWKPTIKQAWIAEAEQRLAEVENGEVETIPGKEVVRSIRERLSKRNT